LAMIYCKSHRYGNLAVVTPFFFPTSGWPVFLLRLFYYKKKGQSGDHPSEDLAKSGYQPEIDLQVLNHLLYIFGYLNENKINESGNLFLLCFSPYFFWLLKTFKSTSFSNLFIIYNLSFCRNVGQFFFLIKKVASAKYNKPSKSEINLKI
jgi:hypothetical protein